jgi:F-type H+-transporting ATPase subunit d
MASKRIAQSAVNWGAMAEKVGDAQRPMFNAFKLKSDAYLRK